MTDTFLDAYIACALWSSNDESTDDGGNPMDRNYGSEDISPETMTAMRANCAKFETENNDKLIDANGDLWPSMAGHDFWLTRNGHGAGFWDGDWPKHGDALTEASKAFGECNLYVGDDGLIYHSS